jgi:hypothetical protein
MRERMKAREEFEDYLEAERTRVQEELLLTDTGAFAELQVLLDEMNNDLLEFDKQTKPLRDILAAIQALITPEC